ncbi:MAG: heme exporter protein CcmD [Fluviibacter sp.]
MMQWQSLSDFFAMGGYGFYVWGSFGVCAAFMIAEPLLVCYRRKQAIRAIQQSQDL